MVPVLFKNHSSCCGCGSCYQKCFSKAITMVEDESGFVFPKIDSAKCLGCNLCLSVCPINNSEKQIKDLYLEHPLVFAARHKNKEILKNSSSGGAFTSLVQTVQPDYVFGVIFDNCFNTIHVSKKPSEINCFQGSKYVQSNTCNTFNETKSYLDSGKKVLYVGTPCQIAGLKSFLNRNYDNLFLCDLICEGVQSQTFFNKFIDDISHNGKKQVKNIKFRNKGNCGWEYSELRIEFEKGRPYVAQCHSTDSFYMTSMIFLGGCRDSCYDCKFNKIPRQGDFTIGDLWGWKSIIPSWDENTGISLLMINSSKAFAYLEQMSAFIEMKQINIGEAISKNPNIIKPTRKPNTRDEYINDLKTMTYEELKEKYYKPRSFLRRLFAKMKHKLFK